MDDFNNSYAYTNGIAYNADRAVILLRAEFGVDTAISSVTVA